MTFPLRKEINQSTDFEDNVLRYVVKDQIFLCAVRLKQRKPAYFQFRSKSSGFHNEQQF